MSYAKAGETELATQTYGILKYLDAGKAETLQQAIERAAAATKAVNSDDDHSKAKRKGKAKGKRKGK